MTESTADLFERAQRLLSEARRDVAPEEDIELLTALLHRTAVELNKAARGKASQTKGQPEWGSWAGLQNTTRSLVLQASTCRDLVRKLSATAPTQGGAEPSGSDG